MADGELYILVLEPPGNIRAEIETVKTGLFRRYGTASVRSLPPVVILDRSSTEPEGTALDEAARRCSRAFSTAGWACHGGSLYLRIEPSPIGAGPDLSDGLPGPFPGILVASEWGNAEALGEPPVFSWGLSRIQVYRVLASGNPWWKNVAWELRAERPTRRNRN